MGLGGVIECLMLFHRVDTKGVAKMLSGGGKPGAYINHRPFFLDKKREKKGKKKESNSCNTIRPASYLSIQIAFDGKFLRLIFNIIKAHN